MVELLEQAKQKYKDNYVPIQNNSSEIDTNVDSYNTDSYTN